MEDVGRELGEMTNCDQSLDPKAVRIEKDAFFFKPQEEIIVGTFVLDSTQGAVA